jgi:hypothetical protein
MAGCSLPYVMAMVAILKSEDWSTFNKAMRGDLPILQAAAIVRTRSRLVDAFRKASFADRVALVKTIGAEKVFDEALVPAL